MSPLHCEDTGLEGNRGRDCVRVYGRECGLDVEDKVDVDVVACKWCREVERGEGCCCVCEEGVVVVLGVREGIVGSSEGVDKHGQEVLLVEEEGCSRA